MTEEIVFHHPLAKELVERTRVLWAIDHARALMSWDLETHMPPRGVEGRAIAFSELAVLRRRLLLDEKITSLVEKLEDKLEELNDYEKGLVRVLSREIRIAKALPEELIARLAKVTSEATKVWSEAKKNNNFEAFKPYLNEIVKLTREKAERLGYKDHPYDALLDLYEEGWTTRDVERMFNKLIPGSKKILEKVLSDEFYPKSHELEQVSYETSKAEKLMKIVLEKLGWSWERGRLDVSPHPFTIELDINDVRITSRYEGKDIRRALYAVIHEFGHALYELQIDPRLARTPLQGGVSLGVHESQSRFWENIIGRSPWFVKAIKPILDEQLGYTAKYSWLELYRYVNIVRPDTIRVEADELTYNLHIYLRFELEKLMVTGELKVDELPDEWNRYMDELLGVKPKNYSEGVLQDIHWSHGSIGYFPTYSLGNVIAAQIRERMLTDIKDMEERLERLELSPLRSWLGSRIHRWGSTYPPRILIEKALGGGYDNPESLIKYLEWKYLKLPNTLSSQA
ncbi:MAG: carboxypeptidase M32 [Pyrodictiaceae archaeon]